MVILMFETKSDWEVKLVIVAIAQGKEKSLKG